MVQDPLKVWRRKRGGGLVWKGVDVGFGGREVVDVEVVEVEEFMEDMEDEEEIGEKLRDSEERSEGRVFKSPRGSQSKEGVGGVRG